MENVEKKYGLDEPIPVQYVKYLGRLVTLRLRRVVLQTASRSPTSSSERAPASLRLAFWAILIEASVGIGAGILSAIRKYSVADTLTTLLRRRARAPSPCSCSAYLFQQVFGVHAFKPGWPEWAQLPVQGIGPERVVPRSSPPRQSST